MVFKKKVKVVAKAKAPAKWAVAGKKAGGFVPFWLNKKWAAGKVKAKVVVKGKKSFGGNE